jgi:hypothetical protein
MRKTMISIPENNPVVERARLVTDGSELEAEQDEKAQNEEEHDAGEEA